MENNFNKQNKPIPNNPCIHTIKLLFNMSSMKSETSKSESLTLASLMPCKTEK